MIEVKNDPYHGKWQRDFPHLYGEWIRFMPAGWYDLIDKLFQEIEAIEPRDPASFSGSVSVSIRRYPGAAVAYAAPNDRAAAWSPDQCYALVQALVRFSSATEKTCEVCGQPSVGVLKYQDGRDQQALCQHHMDERKWS